MDVQMVGVLGAGVMGVGVAQTLAEANYRVLLIDLSAAQLDRAKKEIAQNIRYQKLFGRSGQSSVEVMEKIEYSVEYDLLHGADFIIENTTEKWSVKQDVYHRIDSICQWHCIFAANTSAIPITRIAGITKRPDRVIGTHFMNPVPSKSTVEVIQGYHTAPETIAQTLELLSHIGKEGIIVNDAPGFVSNRVLMLTINEAIFLLQERVSTSRDIDAIFKQCFGHAMGPLETADLIGLDTILLSIEVLYDCFSDSKYRPCPLLRQMVDANMLGRKNGRGFYTYTS